MAPIIMRAIPKILKKSGKTPVVINPIPNNIIPITAIVDGDNDFFIIIFKL